MIVLPSEEREYSNSQKLTVEPIAELLNFPKRECKKSPRNACGKMSECTWRKKAIGPKRTIKAHCRKIPVYKKKSIKTPRSSKSPKKSRKSKKSKSKTLKLTDLSNEFNDSEKAINENKNTQHIFELTLSEKNKTNDQMKPNHINFIRKSEMRSTKEKIYIIEKLIKKLKKRQKVDSVLLQEQYIDALFSSLIPMGQSSRDFYENPLPFLEKLRHMYKFERQFKEKVDETQHILDKINQSKVKVSKGEISQVQKLAKKLCVPKREMSSNNMILNNISSNDFTIVETEKRLDQVLKNHSADSVIIESPKMHVPIFPVDLMSLKPTKWLTDNVLHAYIDLVQTRNDNRHVIKNHKDWNHPVPLMTHQINKIISRESEMVTNIKRIMFSVMEKLKNGGTNNYKSNMVFIPFNIENKHWTLIIVDFRKSNGFDVLYLDSISGNFNLSLVQNHLHKIVQIFKIATAMYYNELYTVNTTEYDINRYNSNNIIDKFDSLDINIIEVTNLQRQNNGYDCGVFVCKYADAFSRNRPLTDLILNSNIERTKITRELLDMKLLVE